MEERRRAVLSQHDIESIIEAIKTNAPTTCNNNCFTEEECVLIRRWIGIMDSTSSWFVKTMLKFLLVVLGIAAWILVGSKWFAGALSSK